VIPLALAVGAWYTVGKIDFVMVRPDGMADPIAAAKLQGAAQVIAAVLVYKVAAR
jgi:hypothetical protein